MPIVLKNLDKVTDSNEFVEAVGLKIPKRLPSVLRRYEILDFYAALSSSERAISTLGARELELLQARGEKELPAIRAAEIDTELSEIEAELNKLQLKQVKTLFRIFAFFLEGLPPAERVDADWLLENVSHPDDISEITTAAMELARYGNQVDDESQDDEGEEGNAPDKTTARKQKSKKTSSSSATPSSDTSPT